jgi:hypothetical protein
MREPLLAARASASLPSNMSRGHFWGVLDFEYSYQHATLGRIITRKSSTCFASLMDWFGGSWTLYILYQI